jgi:uncharacterized protein
MSGVSEINRAMKPVVPVDADGLQILRAWMGSFSSAVVAYSGGVDSALVLAIARECLGNNALACIGVSPSYPQRELEAAIELADRIGVRYRLVQTQEHLDPRYAANPADRCYFCKTELYQRLSAIAAEEGAAVILDGTNASDLNEHRQGYVAAKEHGVRSPLAELGIPKEGVRSLVRHLGLPVWNKPAAPCLASRVPTGVAVVPELLRRIEKAEDALAALGFADFRVRHHGEVARIEMPVESLAAALEKRVAILEGVRAAGYRFVSIDLAGYRSGSVTT